MNRQWQLQEAKARLSDLLRAVATQGRQEITVRGKSAAVVISKADFDRLKPNKPSFVELIRSSPLVGLDLDIQRDRSPMRKLNL